MNLKHLSLSIGLGLITLFMTIGECLAQDASASELSDWQMRVGANPDRDWRSYLLIAPGNMGPNALPIAPSSFALLDTVARFSIRGTHHANSRDQTSDLTAEVRWPVSKRAMLVVRYIVFERYELAQSLVVERGAIRGGSKVIPGDVHVEGHFAMLRRHRVLPDATIAIRIKTASGNDLEALRYTDSPGYQFDASLAKTYRLADDMQIRPFASGGFFVWQRFGAESPQNDAFTYAGGVQITQKRWTSFVELAGYEGWTDRVDKPLQIRSGMEYVLGKRRWAIQGKISHGLRDFEFTSIGVGIILRVGGGVGVR